MQNTDHAITQQEFDYIYSRVPRLTVEIIIKNKVNKIYLTKRAIEPCAGQWHLPGGTVRFGEPLTEAVRRIALRELKINVTDMVNKSYIEYPSHYKNGLDSPVGLVFEVLAFEGKLLVNNEASNGDWFSKLPKKMHADQDIFLIKNSYFKGKI